MFAYGLDKPFEYLRACIRELSLGRRALCGIITRRTVQFDNKALKVCGYTSSCNQITRHNNMTNAKRPQCDTYIYLGTPSAVDFPPTSFSLL